MIDFLNNFFKIFIYFIIVTYFIIFTFIDNRATIETYSLVVLLGLFLSFYFNYYKLLTSPQFILLTTWFISIFLATLNVTYSSHISHFNIKISLETWFLVFCSILSFLIGSTFMLRKVNYKYTYRNLLKLKKIKFDKIIIFSFSLAIIVYLIAIYKNGGVPMLSNNINESRALFIPKTIGILFVLFQLVILLTVIKIFIMGIKGSIHNIILSIFSLLAIILTTQRISMIETVIMVGVFILSFWKFLPSYVKFQNKKKFIINSILLFIILIVVFIIVGNARHLTLNMNTDFENSIIEQLFIYLGGPSIRNFQMILPGGYFSNDIEIKNGILFIREILFFTPYRSETIINDIFKGPNNGTALLHYFYDLGYLGIIIFPLFWGFFLGFVFRIFISTPNIYVIIIYLTFSISIWFSPLSERFSEPTTLLKIVIFSLVIYISQKIKLRY